MQAQGIVDGGGERGQDDEAPAGVLGDLPAFFS